jgi:hypothetical protein
MLGWPQNSTWILQYADALHIADSLHTGKKPASPSCCGSSVPIIRPGMTSARWFSDKSLVGCKN